MRAPGMTLNRIPLFVWSMLVTAFMVIFAMPAVVTGSSFLLLDRLVGTHFYNPAEGGDALLWQHLFWFFGHPEVYIIFVPALGMVSAIVATFTSRPVIGYTSMVLSLVATGFIGFGLWVHHMFATGLPLLGFAYFTAASMIIAVLSGLLLLAVAYVSGVYNLRRVRSTPPLLERAGFAVGWLTLAVAASPWIDRASIERFSAHMAQHELMMLIGAPLVMAGRPLATCLWALPPGLRRPAAGVLQQGGVAGTMRFLATPAAAWALHGAAVWVWHVPVLYEAAVRSEPAHALQHAVFVATSMLFWFGLLQGRYGRAGYGAAVFYVFTTAVHTGIPGAVFALSRSPLYAVYVDAAGADRAAAVRDQQIAGLVMWIPAGILLTLVGVAFFAAWLGESERRGRAGAIAAASVRHPP